MSIYKITINRRNCDHWHWSLNGGTESRVMTGNTADIYAPNGGTLTVKGVDASHNVLATDVAEIAPPVNSVDFVFTPFRAGWERDDNKTHYRVAGLTTFHSPRPHYGEDSSTPGPSRNLLPLSTSQSVSNRGLIDDIAVETGLDAPSIYQFMASMKRGADWESRLSNLQISDLVNSPIFYGSLFGDYMSGEMAQRYKNVTAGGQFAYDTENEHFILNDVFANPSDVSPARPEFSAHQRNGYAYFDTYLNDVGGTDIMQLVSWWDSVDAVDDEIDRELSWLTVHFPQSSEALFNSIRNGTKKMFISLNPINTTGDARGTALNKMPMTMVQSRTKGTGVNVDFTFELPKLSSYTREDSTLAPKFIVSVKYSPRIYPLPACFEESQRQSNISAHPDIPNRGPRRQIASYDMYSRAKSGAGTVLDRYTKRDDHFLGSSGIRHLKFEFEDTQRTAGDSESLYDYTFIDGNYTHAQAISDASSRAGLHSRLANPTTVAEISHMMKSYIAQKGAFSNTSDKSKIFWVNPHTNINFVSSSDGSIMMPPRHGNSDGTRPTTSAVFGSLADGYFQLKDSSFTTGYVLQTERFTIDVQRI